MTQLFKDQNKQNNPRSRPLSGWNRRKAETDTVRVRFNATSEISHFSPSSPRGARGLQDPEAPSHPTMSLYAVTLTLFKGIVDGVRGTGGAAELKSFHPRTECEIIDEKLYWHNFLGVLERESIRASLNTFPFQPVLLHKSIENVHRFSLESHINYF